MTVTPDQLFGILAARPYPGSVDLRMSGGACCFTVEHIAVGYNINGWVALGRVIPAEWTIPGDFLSDSARVHTEIDRVQNIAKQTHTETQTMTTDPCWEQIKADCVGPDLTTVEQKEQTTMTAEQLHNILSNHPYPDANNLTQVTSELMYFNVDGLWIGYDKGIWKAELHLKQYPITPNFPPFGELTVRDVHAEISRVVKIGKSLHANTRAVATETNTTPSPTSTWEQIKGTYWVGPDLPTEQTFVSTDRYQELAAELAKVTAERDELSVRVKQKTDVIVSQAAQIQQHSDGWEQTEAQLEAMTTSRDELQKKVDFIEGRTSNLLAERERLFAKIKRLTEERDRNESSYNYAQNLLNQVWDASGWLEKADNEPCGIEYIKRLKSKADREELLTVEVSKLQEGLTNYKAQVEGLTKRVEQLAFERDAERVGNKWKAETIEDLKRTTVKLPNEHTLRRLFNRHNTPDKYDDGTTIPTIERFLLIIENLCRNADCLERRFEELNAISTRVDTESEDAHATLDEMGIPRWTTVGNHNERYLSLSARIRSVFNTHTKV